MNPAVRSFEESVSRAREAERLGYESVWVTQLPDARDAALVLAAYAAATQWVRLGTGVACDLLCRFSFLREGRSP